MAVVSVFAAADDDLVYPESDGKPMADNDAPRVIIIETLDAGFAAKVHDRDVSADLRCYPATSMLGTQMHRLDRRADADGAFASPRPGRRLLVPL